jgi:tetratricopeptide (TPR) repeat protein
MAEIALPPRFRVERALGAGPRAAWLAFDHEAKALRVLRPLTPTARAGAQLLVGLTHRHLAGVVELVVTASGTFSVAEFADGTSYAERQDELDRAAALEIVLDVLRGLEALHARGLAHGDVAPSNVVVDADGRARLIDPVVPGDAEAPLGTLQFLAPERRLGAPPSPAADVFAVGALAFRAVTGQDAFLGATALDVVRAQESGPPAVAAGEPLAAFLTACLAREPAHRPRDATEARAWLERGLARGPAPEQVDAADAIDRARAALPPPTTQRLFAFLDDRDRVPLVLGGGAGAGKSVALEALIDLAHARGQPALLLRGDEPNAVHAARTRLERLRATVSHGAAEQLVVGIDDFDRSSAELREFVATLLARSRADRPWVAVAGEADECELRLPRDVLGPRSVAMLEPLTERDVARFAKAALPELVAPEALALEAVRRTSGHPAATRALLSRFAAANGFVRASGVWLADLDRLHGVAFDTKAGIGFELATAKLSPHARTLLGLVAAAGCGVALADLAHAAGIDVPQLLRPALDLAGLRLVRHDGGATPRLALRFPLDRAGLLRTLPQERAPLRRLAARLARAPRSPERLAAAARLATEVTSRGAYALWRKSARAFMDARQPAAALDALSRLGALDGTRVARDVWAPRLFGLAHAALGAAAEADPALEAAAHGATGERAVQLVLERAQLLERAGRAADAVAVIDAGLARRDLGDARALIALRAWLTLGQGDKEEARRAARCAAATRPGLGAFDADARSPRDRDGRVLEARGHAPCARRRDRGAARRTQPRARGTRRPFRFDIGVWDLEGAHVARGRKRVRRALETLERVDDRRLLPDTLMRYGWMRFAAGEARSALEAFHRAEILFEKVGNRRGLGWAHNGIGTVLLALGDPEHAAAAFERSVVEREAVGAFSGAGLSAVNLYRAHVARLDLDAARRAARKALHLARGPGRADVRAVFLLAVCQTAARERDGRRLRVLAKRALTAAQVARLDEEAARAAGLVAESALQAGIWPDALTATRRLHRSARRRGHRGDQALAVALRAGLLLLRGRGAEAKRLFARMHAHELEPAAALDVHLLHARLALLAFTRGDGSEARGGRGAAQDASAWPAACPIAMRRSPRAGWSPL